MATITPFAIREARHAAGLSQSQAAKLVHRTLRAWQSWESGERNIDEAAWELFQLKVKRPSATSERGA